MFRTSNVKAVGLSNREAAAIRKKQRRVLPGVFSEAKEPWERYADRCLGVLEQLKPGAALAGPSAAALLKIPLPAVPRKVYVRNIARGAYGEHLVVMPPGPAEEVGDVLISQPARVAADCARLLSSRGALIVADALLAGDWCDSSDLHRVADELAGTTRVQRVRWVADNADPLSESPGETWSRLVLRNLGYDVVSQFHVVLGQREAWLDLLIRGTRLGVEFDGQEKYATYGPRKVVQEKIRDGDLEAEGYRLIRVVWSQLFDHGKVDSRVRHAGGRPVRRPITMNW